VGSIGTGGIAETSFAAGAINAAAIKDAAIDAATFAAGAINAAAVAAGAIHTTALAANSIHTTAMEAGSIHNATFAADVGDTAYATNVIALAADKALLQQNLDHVCGTASGIPTLPEGTWLDVMMDDGTNTYNRTTDSLQAIRDNMAGADAAAIADAVWDELSTGHTDTGKAGARVWTDIPAILVDTGTTLDTNVTAIKTKTDYLPSYAAGTAGGVTIAGSNAATTFATLTSTGALTAGSLAVTGTTTLTGAVTTGAVTKASESITGQFDAGNVLVDTTTVLTGAVTTGAVTKASESITGQLDAGNVLVDTTTVLTGAVSTGAVTLASEAITGALSVGTTTTLTGAVSAPAGVAANITGDITGSLSGAVGTVTLLSANAVAVGSIATGAITAGAIAADAIGASELAADAANEIADALLDRADAVETGLTPRGALRLCSSASAGTLSGADTTTVTIKNAVADSKARITATVDSDGNRSAVSTDVT
jgi:hypothetical protein